MQSRLQPVASPRHMQKRVDDEKRQPGPGGNDRQQPEFLNRKMTRKEPDCSEVFWSWAAPR